MNIEGRLTPVFPQNSSDESNSASKIVIGEDGIMASRINSNAVAEYGLSTPSSSTSAISAPPSSSSAASLSSATTSSAPVATASQTAAMISTPWLENLAQKHQWIPPKRRKSASTSESSSNATASLGALSRGRQRKPRSFNEWFSRLLDDVFYATGLFVADYAKSILALVFIVTAICSLKIPFTPQQDDIKTGYTPNSAQSHAEAILYEQFYRNLTSTDFSATVTAGQKKAVGSGLSAKAQDDPNDPISVVAFVVAKDGGSMLRETHLNETVWVADELATKFQIAGKNFYEFCTDFCQLNEPVRQFKNGIIVLNRHKYHLANVTKHKRAPANENDNEHENDSDLILVDNDLPTSAEAESEANDVLVSRGNGNRINLNFPFVSILGLKLDMSPHFFGVRKYSRAEMTRRSDEFGLNIKFLKLVVLQFRAEKPPGATKEDVTRWERSLSNYLHKELDTSYTRSYVLSITVVGDEIVRTGMTLFPYITVGFAIMSVFSIITVYIGGFYYNQWTVHKVSLALWACICPLLATSSALGFLFWFGFRFGTILAVSPFLIMAIGVDDAYLMIHFYQRICAERVRVKRKESQCAALVSEYRKMDVNDEFDAVAARNDVRERIAEVLVDVGPSITITSLTNVFAFAVGIFSPTPEIQLFCAGNATAIFFDYIYQLFMFTPIIAVAGGYEISLESRRLARESANTISRKNSRRVFPEQLDATAMSQQPIAQPTRRQRLEAKLTRFMALYCQWLASGFTMVLVCVMLVVYWCASLRGALNIDVNITPKKLFLSDSFINDINALRDDYILPNYTAISVFVNRVGDLTDRERLSRVRQLVADFEAMPNSLGSEFTHFWLRDFDKYVETMREDEEEESETGEMLSQLANTSSPIDKELGGFGEKELHAFLHWPEYRHWGGFMRFSDNHRLEKFFAVVAYHGTDLVGWHRRSELLTNWREIAKNYSDLEAWVWAEDAQFLDQIDTLVPATIQSSLATLLCMVIVCGIFMSNLFTVVVATLAIISICIGVFGFLSFWSIDLDPISMATTIMSIGFSVDFPAHVTYHYYRGGLDSELNLRPEERIYQSLIAIGFPLLQCGFSTILFVLCLLFVDTYMSEVFVKTMVLVVSLGLLHGLFIVPTFLCALSNIYDLMCTTRKKLQRTVSEFVEDVSAAPSLRDLVHSTKPAIKIRRHLSKKNIARISVADLPA